MPQFLDHLMDDVAASAAGPAVVEVIELDPQTHFEPSGMAHNGTEEDRKPDDYIDPKGYRIDPARNINLSRPPYVSPRSYRPV